jgi:hypothetical protein
MVIKETATSTRDWRDLRNWRDRLPREIRIHQLVEQGHADRPAMLRDIVRYRAHRLMMRKRKYRLFLDFHAGGDLYKAMEDHHDNWTGLTDVTDEEESLPAGFV